MGEKVESKKEGDKKAAGKKDGDGPTTVVLKLDLHCEGCAKKVKRSISHFEGVEKVKADYASNKLTVTGKVDPSGLRERVEYKTKKKVELVSPPPKKDKDGGDESKKKTDDSKLEKKTEDSKKGDDSKKPKEVHQPAATTVVMKIKLHCEGCANKIKRTIFKNIDGVDSVKTDLEKDTVAVKGTMNVKELTAYLKEKIKKNVDVLPPPKKDEDGGGGGGDKKGKESGGGGGGDKKKDDHKAADGGGGGEGKKLEVNKMEHHSTFSPQTYYATPVYYNQSYYNQDYGVPVHHQYQGSYGNAGHVAQHYYSHGGPPPPPPPTYLRVNDQMFSDENPNGCTVM